MLQIKKSKFYHNIFVIYLSIILLFFLLDGLLKAGLPHISVGRFNIYLLDIFSVLSIIVVFLKLFSNKFQIKQFLIFPLVLGLMLLISYLRGVNQFGFEKATNSFRSALYFFSTLIFTLVVVESKNSIYHILSSWENVAWILFFIAIIRWVLLAGGLIGFSSSWNAAGGLPMRVIDAPRTFFLLQAVIFAFILKTGKFHRLVPALFIISIILLQHRTVWAVLLFLICLVMIQRKQKNNLLIVISLILMSLSVILLLMVSETSVASSLRGSALNFNTFYWRIEGWLRLFSASRYSNIFDYFIGQPFGTGFARFVTSSSGAAYLAEVSPHNFYIFTFLTIGGFGLFILLAIYRQAMSSFIKQKGNDLGFAFALILISQLLFSITYRPSYEQGFLLGAALLLTRHKKYKMINGLL